jgi:hypothetical protein
MESLPRKMTELTGLQLGDNKYLCDMHIRLNEGSVRLTSRRSLQGSHRCLDVLQECFLVNSVLGAAVNG